MHSTRENLWFYLTLQRMITFQAIILALKENRPANSTNHPAKGGLPCSRP